MARVSLTELRNRGWEVVKHYNGSFKLKNGDWDHIFGFETEEHAWGWLSRIGEPRTPKQIDPNPIFWLG